MTAKKANQPKEEPKITHLEIWTAQKNTDILWFRDIPINIQSFIPPNTLLNSVLNLMLTRLCGHVVCQDFVALGVKVSPSIKV